MHEVVLSADTNPNELLVHTNSDAQSTFRHPKLDLPYFQELVDVYDSCKGLICRDIIYSNYFDQAGDKQLVKYLKALTDAAKGIPVIQECRTSGRIGTIKNMVGGFHLYLWRNPWDQWWSYKINDYFETTNLLILNARSRPPVLDRLRAEIAFVGHDAATLSDEFSIYSKKALTSENAYLVFYVLWCLALLEGVGSADLLVNIDALSDSIDYRSDITAKLNTAGFSCIDLYDCHVPQSFYSENDRQFYSRVEDRAHGLFLASGYSQSTIDLLQKLRCTNQPAQWAELGEVVPSAAAVEQSSRLRQLAIRLATANSERQQDCDDLVEGERRVQKAMEEQYRLSLAHSRTDLDRLEHEWETKSLQKEYAWQQAQYELTTQSAERERQLHERLLGTLSDFQKAERQWNESTATLEQDFRAQQAALKSEALFRERELRDELAAAQSRHQEAEGLRAELTGTVEALNEAKESLADMQGQRNALEQELHSIQVQFAEAANVHDAHAQESESLRADLAATVVAMREVKDRLVDADGWVCRLTVDLHKSEDETKRAALRLSAEEQRRWAAEALLERLRRQVQDLAADKQQALNQVVDMQKAQVSTGEVAELRQRLAALNVELDLERQHRSSLENQVSERSADVARLGRQLRRAEDDGQLKSDLVSWLREVDRAVFSQGGWLWRWMPLGWQRRRTLRVLQSKGLFNANQYLARYPDVAQAGMDPLHHYVLHGLDEGRSRW